MAALPKELCFLIVFLVEPVAAPVRKVLEDPFLFSCYNEIDCQVEGTGCGDDGCDTITPNT